MRIDLLMRIKDELLFLKKQDTYPLILFLLYKLKNDPQYTTLSELGFVLDKKNLINLCNYFGGTTLKVPTIDELEEIIAALTLYEQTKLNNKDFKKTLDYLVESGTDKQHLQDLYNKLCIMDSEIV